MDAFLSPYNRKVQIVCLCNNCCLGSQSSCSGNRPLLFIWKISGCCGNAKGHCCNAPCNSSIAAMMQQREHCGNVLQYCGNTCCGNVEGHCKQHQHCGNIAAIRALKQVLRQCAEALPQHQQTALQHNAQRHCSNVSNTPLRQCDCVAAALQQRNSCGGGCQLFPLAPRCCGGCC